MPFSFILAILTRLGALSKKLCPQIIAGYHCGGLGILLNELPVFKPKRKN
jgi:hypothetical protein